VINRSITSAKRRESIYNNFNTIEKLLAKNIFDLESITREFR